MEMLLFMLLDRTSSAVQSSPQPQPVLCISAILTRNKLPWSDRMEGNEQSLWECWQRP